MSIFLSTYINKVDKKGRISVPAPFRSALGTDAAGIVVFRSLQVDALEACSIKHLELLSDRLEQQKLPADVYELIETTIFGGSLHLPFDGEGRITLPRSLLDSVGMSDEISFVGRRKTFQLWDPKKLLAHEQMSRLTAKAKDISLSNIIALSQPFERKED